MKTPVAILVTVALTAAIALLGFGFFGEFTTQPKNTEIVAEGWPPVPASAPKPVGVSAPAAASQPPQVSQPGPDATEVGNQVRAAVREASPTATVGLAVVDVKTNQTLATSDPDRKFRSASLVKLFIALDALTARGPQPKPETLQRMISVSDDDIASALWGANGDGIVRRVASRLKLNSTPPQDILHWGDTMISANDMVKVYRHILTELPREQRDIILKGMHSATPAGKDGYWQYFGIPDGLPGHSWGIKQGWAKGSIVDSHTSGLIDNDSRIVVLLTNHKGVSTYSKTAPQSVTAGIKVLSKVLPAP